MIRKVHHLAIAVTDLEAALAFFRDLLGAQVVKEDISLVERRKAVFLTLGGLTLELMQPLDKEADLGKFIAKRGEGIHSLGFKVDNFEQAVKKLTAASIRVVGQQSQPVKYAFTHPKDTFGVMLEISEYGAPNGGSR